MILPNFLILGPPKCATSSLHGAVCTHPQVSEGSRKELFFLMDRHHPLCGSPNVADDGLRAYGALFPHSAADAAVRVDSTTHYLYQKAALEFVEQSPDCRVCVVLRDPAERVYSSFNYTKNNLANLAGDLSFARFVELVESGRSLYPEFCRNESSAWVLERDIEFSHYARYLAPWLERTGPDRLKIILFDDLRADLPAVAKDVWRWLGVPPHRMDTAVAAPRNVTRAVKYQGLHRIVRRLNAAVPLHAGLKGRLMWGYNALQSGVSARAGDGAAIDNLRSRFSEDVAWLSQFLRRDLRHWLTGGDVR